MRFASLIAVALSLAALALPARAATKCTLDRVASVPMLRDTVGRPTIRVKLNGHDARLLVDTGGIVSLISPGVASALHIERKPLPPGVLVMASGASLVESGTVKTLQLGRLVAKNAKFFVAPSGYVAFGIAGSFGADFLRAWDVDFDFGANRFNLFSPKHCRGEVVYWTKSAYVARPFELNSSKHIQIRVKLNGRTLRAIIDTGSDYSAMNLDLARRLYHIEDTALGPLSPLPHDAFGRETDKPKAYRYRFTKLDLDGIAVKNPEIDLIPNLTLGSEQLIIGMSVLDKLHLYIAYKERKLYMTLANQR